MSVQFQTPTFRVPGLWLFNEQIITLSAKRLWAFVDGCGMLKIGEICFLHVRCVGVCTNPAATCCHCRWNLQVSLDIIRRTQTFWLACGSIWVTLCSQFVDICGHVSIRCNVAVAFLGESPARQRGVARHVNFTWRGVESWRRKDRLGDHGGPGIL